MVEYLNDRIHTIGPWCDTTALNVYDPTEDKPDDTKDNFCVESESVFDQFLGTTYIISVRDFRTKVDKQDTQTDSWKLRVHNTLVIMMRHSKLCQEYNSVSTLQQS
jgi:hypothetical protein